MPIVNLESRAPLNTTARPASSQPSTSKPFAYRTKIDPRKLTWLKDSTSSLPSLFPVSMESVGPGTFPFLCLHCRDPLSIAEEMDVDGTLLFVNENLASSIITAADHTVYMPVTRAQAAMEAQRNKWREETRGSGIRKRSAGTRKRPRARDGVWCSKCGFAYHIGCMHPAEVGMWVGDLAGWVCPGCRESPEGRGLQTVAVSGIFGVRITSVEEIDHKSTEMNNGDKEKTSEAISRENNSEVSESNDDNITLVEVNAEADSATIQASHPPI
ncbi:hypothetical protein BC829DRAFT_80043 [Chytridium lagenaria]|nr:hypothetical protein BC829DRAFT_80043 [Chytridium lagenaria]